MSLACNYRAKLKPWKTATEQKHTKVCGQEFPYTLAKKSMYNELKSDT